MNINTDIIFNGPESKCPLLEKSLGHFILKCLSENKNDLFQIDPETDSTLTRDEFRILSIRCAIQLKQSGLKKDDIVILCIMNRKYCAVALVACIFLGVTVHFLIPDYYESESQRMINLLKPKMIICEKNAIKNYEKVLENLNFDIPILYEYTNENFEQIFLKQSSEENDFEPVDVDVQNSILMIISSSGTTGFTKGIIHSHNSIYYALINNRQMFEKNDRILTYIDMAWDVGVMVTFICIFFNLVRITESINDNLLVKTAELIEKYNITFFIGTPTEVAILVDDPKFDKYPSIKNLRVIWITGHVVLKSLQEKFHALFSNSDVINVYGASEYIGILTYTFETEVNKRKIFSTGKLMNGYSVKILDPTTEKSVGKNQKGVLYIKADSMTPGYYKNPEANRLAFKDGWYNSGDIAYIDDDEYLFVIGRSKDNFKYNGYPVMPALIENIINQHPCVRRSCVMGIPDVKYGELPMAFILQKPGFDVTSEEIIKLVKENSPYVQLYGGVRFLDEFPLTHSGKILRHELKKLLS